MQQQQEEQGAKSLGNVHLRQWEGNSKMTMLLAKAFLGEKEKERASRKQTTTWFYPPPQRPSLAQQSAGNLIKANWASGRKDPSRSLRMNQAQLPFTSVTRERNRVRRMRQREMKMALERRKRQGQGQL